MNDWESLNRMVNGDNLKPIRGTNAGVRGTGEIIFSGLPEDNSPQTGPGTAQFANEWFNRVASKPRQDAGATEASGFTGADPFINSTPRRGTIRRFLDRRRAWPVARAVCAWCDWHRGASVQKLGNFLGITGEEAERLVADAEFFKRIDEKTRRIRAMIQRGWLGRNRKMTMMRVDNGKPVVRLPKGEIWELPDGKMVVILGGSLEAALAQRGEPVEVAEATATEILEAGQLIEQRKNRFQARDESGRQLVKEIETWDATKTSNALAVVKALRQFYGHDSYVMQNGPKLFGWDGQSYEKSGDQIITLLNELDARERADRIIAERKGGTKP